MSIRLWSIEMEEVLFHAGTTAFRSQKRVPAHFTRDLTRYANHSLLLSIDPKYFKYSLTL
jgi:hypothetical protein